MLSLMALVLLSCTDDSNIDSLTTSDFEIYLTESHLSYSSSIDYGDIDLDTIVLKDSPFLSTNDIKSYDTVHHILNLKKSKRELDYPASSVYGHMFVVLIDKNPVYCGFFWSLLSSVPCNWIMIEEPNESDGLTETQLQINLGYPNDSHFQGVDPRDNEMILRALTELGLLTGNTKSDGKGLNFYLVIKSKIDTTGVLLQTPIDALDIENKPFISYNEIKSYDTLQHVLELTISHDTIKNRINSYGNQFVASLDEDRTYSGLLVPITSSMIYPTITIIEPYYSLDSLEPNQIKVSLGYPNDTYFDSEDLRLTKDIKERLIRDKKAK